uniref:HORMA domain-containing protein n=1 Tax=Caenorhabditis tropicalis TaxID=1561998 RepID=A0A1I7T8Q9_9PELO
MQKRDSVSSAKWEMTFPATLETELDSATFVHRLIKISSSFILDKRGIFENHGDTFFKSRIIEKLYIPMFNKDNTMAKLLIDKIEALKEAIQKKYLREFAIVFYQTPDEEDVMEVFAFRLMYGAEDQIEVSLSSDIDSEEFSENLIQATFTDLDATKAVFSDTIKKVHRCIKQLDNLPHESDASFRVSFTPETPNDYIPTGYDASSEFYKLNSSAAKRQIGVICGGHHKLQFLAASRLWKSVPDLNQSIGSCNQSIIALSTKAKSVKGSQKKTDRVEQRMPYGKTLTINKNRA